MPAPLLFLFDYVSPYSYLASTQVRALAARHGRQVEPVAVVDGGSRWAFVDALFRAAWVERRRVDAPEVVQQVAGEAGLDGAALVTASAAPDAKQRLRANTDEALAAGVFGVPTVRVDAELFWGVDSLPHLDAFLAGKGAIDADMLARWRAVSPSVTRKAGA